MSITYVGGNNNQIYNTTAQTISLPTGAQPGDLAVLFFCTGGTTDGNASTTTITGDWTQNGSTALSDQGSTSTIDSRVYTKMLDSSTISSGFDVTTDGAQVVVTVLVYRGISSSDAVSACQSSSDHPSPNVTTVTAPTVTVPSGGALVQFVATRVSSNTGTWTAPTGMTSREASSSTNNLVNGVSADDLTGATSGGGIYTAPVAAPRYAAWSVALSAAAPKHIVVRRATDGSWQ